MSTLTVSLIQMDVKKGDPSANWATVQQCTAEAAQRGAQLVVLPELWDAGAAYNQCASLASPLDGGLFAQVSALAQQHGVFIIGSQFEKRGSRIHNTLAVVAPHGIIGAYRKLHLFPLMQEDQWLAPGDAPVTLELPWGRAGFAICYDLRFPELFRRYADSRADLVIIPSEWPHPRLMHYRTLLRARAIENQVFMIAANRVGKDPDGTRFFGHSSVIDPWGEIVVEAGESECHLTVTLDLEMVQQVREQLPALKDRRL